MTFTLAGTVSIAAQAVAMTGLFMLASQSRRFSSAFYIVTPIVIVILGLSLGNQTGFGWIKLISVCLACVWINLLRTTGMGKKDFFLYMIVAIFIGNILEASIQNLIAITPVNALNSFLGLALIISIDYRQKPRIETEKPFGLLWHGVDRTWIVSYTLWNIAFIYVHFPSSFFYHIVVLSVPLVGEFLKPGIWGQARAYTLAVWMMMLFAFSHWMDRYSFIVGLDWRILAAMNGLAMALLILRLARALTRRFAVRHRR